MPDNPLIIDESAARPAPKKKPSWQVMLELAARMGQQSEPAPDAPAVAADAPPLVAKPRTLYDGPALTNEMDAPPPMMRAVTPAPAPTIAPRPAAAKRPAWQEVKEIAERHGGRVTSTTGGKHNVGSKHYGGDAIDVGMAQESPAKQEQIIQGMRNDGLLVFDERTKPKGQKVYGGPHVHVEKAKIARADVEEFLARKAARPNASSSSLSAIGIAPKSSFQQIAEEARVADQNRRLAEKAKSQSVPPAVPLSQIGIPSKPAFQQIADDVIAADQSRKAQIDKRLKTPIQIGKNPTAIQIPSQVEMSAEGKRRMQMQADEDATTIANRPAPAPSVPRSWLGDKATRVARGAINSTLDIPEGIATLAGASLPKAPALLDAGAKKMVSEMPSKLRQSIAQDLGIDRAREWTERATVPDATQNGFVGDLAEGAGSTVPFFVGAVLTRGGSLTSAYLGALQNASGTYRDARQNGASEDQAYAASRVGALIGISEAAGLGRTLDKLGMSRPLMKRAMDIAEEGGQEAVSSFLNNVNAKIVTAYDPKRGLDEDVLKSGLIGAMIGGGVQAGSAAGVGIGNVAALRQGLGEAVPEATQGLSAEMGGQSAPPSVRSPQPAAIGPQMLKTVAEMLPEIVRQHNLPMSSEQITQVAQQLRSGEMPPEIAALPEGAPTSSTGDSAGSPVVGAEAYSPAQPPTSLFHRQLARNPQTGAPTVVDPNLDPVAAQMARLSEILTPEKPAKKSPQEKALAAEANYTEALSLGEPQTIAATRSEYLRAADAYLSTLPVAEAVEIRQSPQWQALIAKPKGKTSSQPTPVAQGESSPNPQVSTTAPTARPQPLPDPNRELSGIELAALRKRLSVEEILNLSPTQARQLLYGRQATPEATPKTETAPVLNPNSIKAKMEAIRARRAQESLVQSGNDQRSREELNGHRLYTSSEAGRDAGSNRTARSNEIHREDTGGAPATANTQTKARAVDEPIFSAQPQEPTGLPGSVSDRTDTRPLRPHERYTLTRQLGYSPNDLKTLSPIEGRDIIARSASKPREQVEIERRQRQFDDAVNRGDKLSAEREASALVALLRVQQRQAKDAVGQANLAEQITGIQQQARAVKTGGQATAVATPRPAQTARTQPAPAPPVTQSGSSAAGQFAPPATARRDATDRENLISLIRKNGGVRITDNNAGEYRDLVREYPGLFSRNKGIGEDQMIEALNAEGYSGIPAQPGALATHLRSYKQDRARQVETEQQATNEGRYADLGRNGYDLYNRIVAGDDSVIDDFDAYMETALKFPRDVRTRYIQEAQDERAVNSTAGAERTTARSNATLAVSDTEDGAGNSAQNRVLPEVLEYPDRAIPSDDELNEMAAREESERFGAQPFVPTAQSAREEVESLSEMDLLDRRRMQELQARRAEIRDAAPTGQHGKLASLARKAMGEGLPALADHPDWKRVLDITPDASQQDVLNAIAQDLAGVERSSMMSPQHWMDVLSKFAGDWSSDLKTVVSQTLAASDMFSQRKDAFLADAKVQELFAREVPPRGMAQRVRDLQRLAEKYNGNQDEPSNITKHWIEETFKQQRAASSRTTSDRADAARRDESRAEVGGQAQTANDRSQPAQSEFAQPATQTTVTASGNERAERRPRPQPTTEGDQPATESVKTITHQQPQLDGARVVAETPSHIVVEKTDGNETLVKKDSAHLREAPTTDHRPLTTDQLVQVQRKFDSLKAESQKSGQPLDGAIDDFLNQDNLFGEKFSDAQATALREMATKEPKTATGAPASGSLFDVAPTPKSKLTAAQEQRAKEDAKRNADAPLPMFANVASGEMPAKNTPMQQAKSLLAGRFEATTDDLNEYRRQFGQMDFTGSGANDLHVVDVAANENLLDAPESKIQQTIDRHRKTLEAARAQQATRMKNGRTIGGTAGALNRDIDRIGTKIDAAKAAIQRLEKELERRVAANQQPHDAPLAKPETPKTAPSDTVARERYDKAVAELRKGVNDNGNLFSPAKRTALTDDVRKLGKQLGLAQTVEAQKRDTPSSPVAKHFDLIGRVQKGEVKAEEFKTAFEELTDSKDAIITELSTLTKDDIFEKFPDIQWRYKNDKKADVVDAAYREMQSDFVLGQSFSYGMGKDSYAQGVRVKVNQVTDEALSDYAERVKQTRAKRSEQLKEMQAGIQDPKTLEDFQNFIRVKAKEIGESARFREIRMMLTPEQRATFDELAGAKTRDERKARADQQKIDVGAANQSMTGDIIETKHTKTGEPLFVVKTTERVDRAVYNEWNATAKRLGGWYSSFRGAGAVPGFQFKTQANAEAFLEYLGGKVGKAKEAMQARRDAMQDDKSQTAVERLREMADNLDGRADESLAVERKANTARRARFAASAEASANADKAMAVTMRNVANAIETGKAKFLDRVRQKVQVELLQSYVASGQDSYLREKFKSYFDREKHQGMPTTIEAADYAEFPSYTAFRSDLAKLGRQLSEQEGTKKIGASILKVADDVTDAYLKFAKENLHKVSTFKRKDGETATFTSKASAEAAIARSGYKGKAIVLPFKRNENLIILSPSAAKEKGVWQGDNDTRVTLDPSIGDELVAKLKSRNRRGIDIPWTFEAAAEKRKRLAGMGIERPAELRAAVREFIGLREQTKAPDKIKEMERAMVGRKNDGLDFFPTPVSVSEQMIAAANLEEGMTVLEPSAGMGHIADRLREAGVEPDVVEMASDRRELLKAKGYSVAGQDFLEVTGQYDRIVMNPPFSDRRDAQHVQHAYELLKPGGRLVAIMGEGSFFGGDKKATAFREWLESVDGTSEKLEEGSFLDPSLPVNTGVNARMVVIDKPAFDPVQQLQERAKEAEPRIKASLNKEAGRAFILEDLSAWMAAKISDGMKSLRDLTRAAIQTFGPRIRQFITAAWKRAKEFTADELGSNTIDFTDIRKAKGESGQSSSLPKELIPLPPDFSWDKYAKELKKTIVKLAEDKKLPEKSLDGLIENVAALKAAVDKGDGAEVAKQRVALHRRLVNRKLAITSDLLRPLMLAGDLVMGRQGFAGWVTHPMTSWKTLMATKGALSPRGGDQVYYRELAKMLNDPHLPLAKDAGIDFGVLHELEAGARLLQSEEGSFSSGFANWPVVRQIEHFNKVYMDLYRLQVFAAEMERRKAKGVQISTKGKPTEDTKDWARRINIVSGRAHLGDGKVRSAVEASSAFGLNAPRWAISRFQSLNPYEYTRAVVRMFTGKNPETAKQVGKEAVSFALVQGGMIGLGMAALAMGLIDGFEWEDPDNPNWMMVRKGERRYSAIQGGLRPYARFGLQLLKRGYEIAGTAYSKNRFDTKARDKAFDQVMRFGRTRLAPMVGLGLDQTVFRAEVDEYGRALSEERRRAMKPEELAKMETRGFDAAGQPNTLTESLFGRVVPLTYKNIVMGGWEAAMKEREMSDRVWAGLGGAAAHTPEFFGLDMNEYPDRDAKVEGIPFARRKWQAGGYGDVRDFVTDKGFESDADFQKTIDQRKPAVDAILKGLGAVSGEQRARVLREALDEPSMDRAMKLKLDSVAREAAIDVQKDADWQTIVNDARYQSLSKQEKEKLRATFAANYAKYRSAVSSKTGKEIKTAKLLPESARQAALKRAERAMGR